MPIASFADLSVLVIGDLLLDESIDGFSARNCPDDPSAPVIDDAEPPREGLGGAGNTAANAAALGARVTLVGLVGDDADGDRIAELVEAGSIRSRLHVSRRTTLTKSRISADGRLLARVDRGTTAPIDGSDEARVIGDIRACWGSADVVIVSDYSKGLCTPGVIDAIARLNAGDRKILVVDAKELLQYLYCGATAFTPNRIERQRLSGVPRHRLPDLVVETLDADGCIGYRLGRDPVVVPGIPVHPAHPSGAGDTFAACLGLALASGAGDREALTLANRAASIVVGKPFTATCTAAELAASIEPRPRIVLAAGTFDVFHAGHAYLLREAAKLGDELVVAINSDASIARLKGCGRPVHRQAHRVAVLEALRCVSRVVVFEQETPADVIRRIRPAYFVKGGDYSRETLPEADLVEQLGGEVVIVPRLAGLSSTATIERAATTRRYVGSGG